MRNQGKSVLAAPLGWAVRKASGGYDRFFNPDRTTLVSLEPKGAVRGRVLLAHVIEGFLAKQTDPLIRRHNHYVEGRLLPEIFLELGYAVDYISWRNYRYLPRRRYDIFFGPREYFERLSAKLNDDCIKIVHLDTKHWLTSNSAALTRLKDLQSRRGVSINSYKHINFNRAIEVADYATILGNEDTYESYRFARKQAFQVPNPSNALYPDPKQKDIEACRRNFLWLGSDGLVHKGLDLVLDAFVRMPEMHLTICGPITKDVHFVEHFKRELYETPNIRTYDWIDITSADFLEIVNGTLGLVYPSCAEACCGSVANCMHAGLIPIVSRQSGIDIAPDFGRVLDDLTVPAIENAVRSIAALPATQLADMARRTWLEARQIYASEYYKEVLSTIIGHIVSNHPIGSSGFVPIRRPSSLAAAAAPRRGDDEDADQRVAPVIVRRR